MILSEEFIHASQGRGEEYAEQVIGTLKTLPVTQCVHLNRDGEEEGPERKEYALLLAVPRW